jgi:ABC-type Fe3+-citrate transport system substrate-binding protein
LVYTQENNPLTTISSIEPAWELSVSDAITDKYKEMEKRVEEQDKTIAEMKSIIENLQDIVYQRKLDKEAETLVL